jgi:hypothetical protein
LGADFEKDGKYGIFDNSLFRKPWELQMGLISFHSIPKVGIKATKMG